MATGKVDYELSQILNSHLPFDSVGGAKAEYKERFLKLIAVFQLSLIRVLGLAILIKMFVLFSSLSGIGFIAVEIGFIAVEIGFVGYLAYGLRKAKFRRAMKKSAIRAIRMWSEVHSSVVSSISTSLFLLVFASYFFFFPLAVRLDLIAKDSPIERAPTSFLMPLGIAALGGLSLCWTLATIGKAIVKKETERYKD